MPVVWIRIRSDRHHFSGSRLASRACRSGPDPDPHLTIPTRCKVKLYAFPENFSILFEILKKYVTFDADEEDKM
jgi:hypothetical protein